MRMVYSYRPTAKFLIGITLICLTLLLASNHMSFNKHYKQFSHAKAQYKKYISPYVSKPYLLDSLDIDCQGMMKNNTNGTTEAGLAEKLKKTKLFANLEAEIRNSTDRCAKLDELFNFRKFPSSEEEAEYPLAYGILAYKNVIQVLFMLSSFYHPQNVYCIGVSENAGIPYIELMRNLTSCWPNVHFMVRPSMEWGSHEIINSLYTIFEFLTNLKSEWKYFQYLSGFDVPLKTNLEMVRIFKALNGTPNYDVVPFMKDRVKGKNMSDSPLPLFKSSLSVLIPRQVANAMVFSTIPHDLLHFLKNTSIPDESFWGTLLGNKELFNFPGAISGSKWLQHQQNITNKKTDTLQKGLQQKYYVSRYQVFYRAKVLPCRGYHQRGSCVFSILDLPYLIESKPLVGHKIYMEKYPAAFFCALKEIQTRADNPEKYHFNTSFYENLPQVQMSRGIPLELVTKDTLIF